MRAVAGRRGAGRGNASFTNRGHARCESPPETARVLRPTLTALLALGASFTAAAAADLLPPRLDAADLAPAAFAPGTLDAPAYDEDVVVRRRVLRPPPLPVEPRVVVTSPLSVGGPYMIVPGLNGPTGPAAYPLLPYAFGYGY